MRSLFLLFGLCAPLSALAQGSAPAVPQAHVPPPVVAELRNLERQFDLALANDCAPERCFSKGCVYLNHLAVDMPRAGSLPGLGQAEGPGSVPAQEYLTEARCEFTHEKSVPAKDVQALTRRLEMRLSRGWLKVTVGRQVLEPISPFLKESAPAPEPKPPPPPEAPVVAEKKPDTFEAGVAARELWVSLLPHFSWMIAILLVTLAALAVIWGLRRLGRESAEEKALLAQLASGPKPADAAEPKDQAPSPAGANGEDPEHLEEQKRLWLERVGQAELGGTNGVVVELLRDWLRTGEFALLAKAISLFGDQLSQAFPSDGELAVRKLELAEYLRSAKPEELPSDAEFFRTLSQHAISSSLLAQDDAGIFRSFHEEFGASGILGLVEKVPPRHGALLFAFAPSPMQHEVARLMSPEVREEVVRQLLASNRVSKEETGHLFSVLDAARKGEAVPPPPRPVGLADRGREFDAPGALSVLLPFLPAERRRELFSQAQELSGGVLPRWHESILFGDMLLRLPDELRKDLLLEVDVRALAGWASLQDSAWQERFARGLSPALQNALRAGLSFESRGEQLRQARRGHDELVAAMKRQVVKGTVAFTDLLA